MTATIMQSPIIRDAALPMAIAASLALHASAFAVLLGLDAGTRPGARTLAEANPVPLEARLVAVPREVPPPAEAAPVEIPSPLAKESIARTHDKPAESAPVPRPASNATPTQTTLGWRPRIVVNDRPPRARFGAAFDGDELSGFPIEVDAAVVVPDRLDIPYPSAALAARREGTVLAWAVIDDQGAVESINVVEGDPEFAEAVQSVLAKTRFIPAHDHGKTLRFYVTLEFDFRIETPGAAGDVASTPAPAR